MRAPVRQTMPPELYMRFYDSIQMKDVLLHMRVTKRQRWDPLCMSVHQ